MVAPLLPLYVQRHAGGALLAGALGSVYAVMQVLGAPVIGSFADRHGRRTVLVACLLGSCAAYLAVAVARSMGGLFAAVAFGGLMGGSFATAQAYIADGSSPSERTRWLSLAGAAVGLGIAAGPFLGGLLGREVFGSRPSRRAVLRWPMPCSGSWFCGTTARAWKGPIGGISGSIPSALRRPVQPTELRPFSSRSRR